MAAPNRPARPGLRFDHAVIAVRDLPSATRQFRVAGFDVSEGGRHTGFGTENAIIRFGLDYLELISVYDADAASARSARGRVLVELLRDVPAAFAGFALATSDLGAVRDDLIAAGVTPPLLSDMQRTRPDGTVLRWQLLIPGEVAWRRPWPFFIAWSTSDDERLRLERPGQHALPVTGVAGVTVAVSDLGAAVRFYRAALAAAPADERAGERARFVVGPFVVTLVRPAGASAGDELEGQMSGLALRAGPMDSARVRRSPSSVTPMPGITIELVP